MSVLEVDDVSIRFGGLTALSGFTVRVGEHEIVGLIGPNGAGKTTAFNCITGFYKPNSGNVRYRGRDISRTPPHKRSAMGLGRTFQNVGLVKGATVLDNLKTAQHAGVHYGAGAGMLGGPQSRLIEHELSAKGASVLELLGLSDLLHKQVGGLSYGTLKKLEVACALATDPDLMLLDEPSSGLGPEEAHELGDRLLDLRRDFGVSILLIEHHVPLVKAVCDYVYCLTAGRLLAEGSPDEVTTHPEVVAAYLGGEAPDALAATQDTEEDAALDAQLHDAVEQHGTGAPPAAASSVAPPAAAPADAQDTVRARRPRRALRAAAPDPAEVDTGLDVFAAPADGGVPNVPPSDEQPAAPAGRRRRGGA